MQIYIYIYIYIKYIKLGFTPRKSEQPLQSMELQEKEAQKMKSFRKSLQKESTVNRCLLVLDVHSYKGGFITTV